MIYAYDIRGRILVVEADDSTRALEALVALGEVAQGTTPDLQSFGNVLEVCQSSRGLDVEVLG